MRIDSLILQNSAVGNLVSVNLESGVYPRKLFRAGSPRRAGRNVQEGTPGSNTPNSMRNPIPLTFGVM